MSAAFSPPILGPAKDGMALVVGAANRILADAQAGRFRGLAIAYVSDDPPRLYNMAGVFLDPRDVEAASKLAEAFEALRQQWLGAGQERH